MNEWMNECKKWINEWKWMCEKINELKLIKMNKWLKINEWMKMNERQGDR